MANQIVNSNNALISRLLNGKTITINGSSVTIDDDVRWNQKGGE